MIRLGSIRIAGEVIEVWHDPALASAGEFDPTADPPRIVIRERGVKRAVHELGHAIVWAHCLGELFSRGGEEALCGALEISALEGVHRLESLFADPDDE